VCADYELDLLKALSRVEDTVAEIIQILEEARMLFNPELRPKELESKQEEELTPFKLEVIAAKALIDQQAADASKSLIKDDSSFLN